MYEFCNKVIASISVVFRSLKAGASVEQEKSDRRSLSALTSACFSRVGERGPSSNRVPSEAGTRTERK